MAFDVLNQPPQPLELDPVHAPIQLDFSSPSAKTNFLHLQGKKMSRRSGPKLDLKLNLSPPRANPHAESPATASPTSPPSSCVSSELNQDESTLRYSNSPEATSMMLVGCPRCLMYVMLAEADPRCPKCKSTVLLDVFNENPVAAAATVVAVNKTRKS
ncbi:hypothetical protein RHGRI_006919 [Rhododendron griersonianum]|uniref:GIR1-like zinc ribbon domain-containing protein n=1 Tax=Rhododendron griersonianum TaxID=479676 RepID=A0AAV6KVL9_9ERIC|nr:hypothetical protein RHGRI_006919 [Rhododendron griersonianum]